MINTSTEIDTLKDNKLFSICTLVTDLNEYKEMLDSFEKAGFIEEFCEFLFIDNSQTNKYDGYSGFNKFLNKASGKYIILCHQDILLKFDNIEVLKQRIEEVNQLDQSWAILANAGYGDFNYYSIRITDPHTKNKNSKIFPSKVKTVDENFIVVKNEANLACSHNIEGFHLYGTDLCIVADILGYSAYVINFHLFHKSGGNPNKDFYINKNRFIKKYKNVISNKFLRTPVTPLFISSNSFLNLLCNMQRCYNLKSRWNYLVEKFKKNNSKGK